MLKIITGSAREDISGIALGDMTRRATEHRDEKFIIIVPEQFTLQTQKRVVELHPHHACMNIDVVSFDRLAHVVLAKLGRDISEVLDDVGKALILRNVLTDIQDDLCVYGRKIHMPGFIEELKSLITEFMQYRIDDNMLYLMQTDSEAQGGFLAEKLKDIRLIFDRFNKEIEDTYNTSEEVMDIFARLLTESDFLKNSHIYLDGFTGFTPIQYRIIRKMLNIASDVTCTVSVPQGSLRADPPEYDLFALPDQTFYKLKEIAEEEHVDVVHECAKPYKQAERKLCIKGCSDLKDEVRFAAGQILDLVRSGSCRFRDIAVLTTDMESYYAHLKSIFREAGIPAFIDYKEEFTDNLLVRLVLSALEVSVKGMLYEPVFAFLKTGFTDITPDECSILENYVLEFNIRGRNRWESSFAANREIRSGEFYWDLERINDIRKRAAYAICRFYGRTSSRERKVTVFCSALKALLDELDVQNRMDERAAAFEVEGELEYALQYSQIYEQITLLIDRIEMLMGSSSMTAKEFQAIVESGISEIKLGIIPPSLDALTAGDLTRTRFGDIKHLFMIGANEGKIPSAGSGSALFTQKERAALRKDYEIAPTIQENIYTQRYYLYLAFARPAERLYITYAWASASGEQLTPSSILEDLDELIPDENMEYTEAGEGALWAAGALKTCADNLKKMVQQGSFKGDEMLEFFAKEEPDTLRAILRGALLSNVRTPLDGRVALDLYGDVLKGSVSRYECFYECPFRHFLNYGLHLEKRREYKVEAADLGTIYHDALEKYSKAIAEGGYSFRSIDDDESHRIIAECVKEAIEEKDDGVLTGSFRNEYLTKRISQISEKTTDVLREHVRDGLFEPSEFEFTFDEAAGDDARFRGKIDRIDMYDGGDLFIKIIDYKSGGKKFNIRDVYSGVQLQLACYMGSALKASKERYPDRNVRPGGVYYYLINDRYVRDSEDIEKKNQMSGITLMDADVIHAVDTTLGQDGKQKSSIVPVSLTRNGVSAYSQVAAASEFDGLIRFAEDKVREAASRIKSGDISLNPFRKNDTENGCRYCDYKDICRFEAGSFGTDWRQEGKELKEMEDEVYGRHKVD